MAEPTPIRPAAGEAHRARKALMEMMHRLFDWVPGDDHDCGSAGVALELGMHIALVHPEFAERMLKVIDDGLGASPPPYSGVEMDLAVAIAHGETS